MDLDELIYSKFLKLVRKFKNKEDPEITKITIVLESISGRLTLLSRAMTGKNISIFPAKREGGLKEQYFLLPNNFSRYSSLELNLKYYLFRIIYLSIQFKINLNKLIFNSKISKISIDKASIYENNSQLIIAEMLDEYPNINQTYLELIKEEELIAKKNDDECDFSFIYGKEMLPISSFNDEIDDTFLNNKKNSDAFNENNITTELDSKPVEEIETIAVNKKAQKEFVITNNFEKVDTADEFNGIWREFDGDDDLGDHKEALEALDLKYTVRVDDPVHSIYKAEFAPGTNSIEVTVNESSTKCYYYNEWDYKKQTYKKDYCRVYTSNSNSINNEYYNSVLKTKKRIISDLKVLFAKVNNELQKIHNSITGEDIDFDAFVETYPDFISKKTPDEKLYISKSKKKNDLSILILVDTSLSSDGYTGGRRVLDIQKESLICFGEVLNEYNVEFQIDTFNSKTRNYCYYKNIKKFNENWDNTKQKIGVIEADSYTRIGPALRHAGEELENASNSKKWILLLTDGKPNDYDRYEGNQGLEDVKKALYELENKGINTFALAIESISRYYLPLMFGHRNYNILSKPEDLPKSLGDFYRRILKN